jgi:hypothetical protein
VGVIEERLEARGLRLPRPFAQAGREYNFRVVKVQAPLKAPPTSCSSSGVSAQLHTRVHTFWRKSTG